MQISTFVILGILAASTLVAQSPKESEHAREVFAHHAGNRMSLNKFQALPRQPADFSLSYGTDKNQLGELRLPLGPGPHPLAVLIHGGCWFADFATLNDLGPIADALKAEGIATWNIEYRRLSQPGSGWPGTYLDVGKAIDFVRTIAASSMSKILCLFAALSILPVQATWRPISKRNNVRAATKLSRRCREGSPRTSLSMLAHACRTDLPIQC